jgi:diguanylate cyclase (GGDEF)-like protein/PAS domain S-box-containing protein
MSFRFKLVAAIVILEIILLAAVGVVVSFHLSPGGMDFSFPLFMIVAIATLLLGALVAVAISHLTNLEIVDKTGAMQEVWERSMIILHSIPVGIVIIDPKTHRIVEANLAALDAFRAPKSKVIGQNCHRYLCPAEKDFCPITSLKQQSDASEGLVVTSRGEEIPVFKTVKPIKLGKRQLLLETFFDISERKKLERSLKDAFTHQQTMANYDTLTGMLNRRAISKFAEAELARAERGGALTVVMMDLDHFKRINDTHGHPVGDEVLKQVSAVISKNVRPYDWVGRWGGEEFLVLLPNTGVKEAMEIAERLRSAIQATSIPLSQDKQLRVTASFGVACTAEIGKSFISLDTITTLVDGALYRAKAKGRNRVCLAESDVSQ